MVQVTKIVILVPLVITYTTKHNVFLIVQWVIIKNFHIKFVLIVIMNVPPVKVKLYVIHVNKDTSFKIKNV